jgi:adenylate cyclase
MAVALLFCDLKNFTVYAEENGDAAAVEAIDLFARVVGEERGEEGSIVKGMGDGFILAYAHPGEAVAAGLGIIERMAGDPAPRVHASVYYGPAVFRAGDYYGRTVNLAARLLGLAGGDELLATSEVAEASGERFDWHNHATMSIRGFADPVEVYRLSK